MSDVVRHRANTRVALGTVTMVIVGILAGVGGASAQQDSGVQTVVRASSRPAAPGPATRFIGKVTVTPIADPRAPGRTSLGSVTFAPGARSDWHTHPAGQILYVLEGCGWNQQ